MSLSYSESDKPICKCGQHVVYLHENDDTYKKIPSINVKEYQYQCPYCKLILSCKNTLISHMKKGCKAVKDTKMFTRFKCNDGKFVYLPQRYEVAFITGIPGCGKTFFMNQYAKSFIKLYDGNVVIFTTHEHDETMGEDEKNYLIVKISDEITKDPFELKDLENCLVVFDDIESSKFPKATKYMLNLMEDIAKNGRHYNINMIFINQECRMGKVTKKILTLCTKIVIFPKTGETYQNQRLLKEYCGLSDQRSKYVMDLNSRWVLFSRPYPQYVLTENEVFINGKEIY